MAKLSTFLGIILSMDKEDCQRLKVLHIVTKAVPQPDMKVAVEFDGGERGLYDCSRLAEDPYWACLKNPAFFKTARAEYGTIVWDNNIDVAPESVWEDVDLR